MKAIEFVLSLSNKVPELPLSSKSADKVRLIDKRADGKRYASAAFFLSIVLAAVIGMIAFSAIASLLSFAFIFYFLLGLPGMELQQEARAMELELPFFMRETGFLVGVGLPFEKALEVAAKGKGKLAGKIRAAIEEMKSGSTFQKAMSGIAIESDSTQVKRAFSALISAYEQGKSANLEKVSDELLMVQRHAIKDAASRMALFGLLFIAFSAVAPTFFMIYFVLGQAIFQTDITPIAFAVVMLLLFPAIDLVILVLAGSSLPASREDRFCLNPLEFHRIQKRKEELEKYLPDALLSISSVPSGSSAETAFSAVAKGKYGVLSAEFETSLKQLRSKISLQKTLEDLAARNGSAMLSKAADMLAQLFATNNFPMAAKLAEDFIAEQEIAGERANAFSMQKYTLFFGALVIPVILSVTVSLSTSMAGVMGKGSADIGLCLQAYLLIYCAMAAYFSAFMENRRSMALVYFICLSAVSLLTFNMVKVFW